MNRYETENVYRIINKIKELEKTEKMSDIRKAYYLYRELGKIYQYKINYAFMDPNIKDELIEKVYLYEDGTNNDGEALCIDMDKTYVEALDLLGIEAKLSFLDENNPISHANVIFKDEEENYYYADIVGDIMHIKTGMKIRNFGLTEEQALNKLFKRECNAKTNYKDKLKKETKGKITRISEEQLKQWDDKDGYTYEGFYTNDVLDMLAKEMLDEEFLYGFFGTNKKDELVQKKIEFIMERLEIINIHRRKRIGDYEAGRYYEKILNKILTKEEREKYAQINAGYVEEYGERKARFVMVIKKEKENVYYLYNNQSQIFEIIEKEEFIKEPIKYINRPGQKINNIQFVNHFEKRLQERDR